MNRGIFAVYLPILRDTGNGKEAQYRLKKKKNQFFRRVVSLNETKKILSITPRAIII